MELHAPQPCATPRTPTRRFPNGYVAAVAAGLLGLAAGPASAATLTVDRFDDPALGASPTCTVAPADCSLRQAIQAASESNVSTTVVLPAGLYQLTLAGADEDLNQTGDLDVFGEISSKNVVIQGAGAATTIIEQTVGDRIFQFHFEIFGVSLSGLTLRGGGGVPTGGAVASNNRRLEMTDVVVRDSAATSLGGCVFRLRLSNDLGASFERVHFSGCTSGGAAGALLLETAGDSAPSEILASRFEGNQATSLAGAAYLSLMQLVTVEDTVFAGNVSLGQQTELTGSGGGVVFHNVGAIVRRSAFVDNRAGSAGSVLGEGGAAVADDGAAVSFENVTFARNHVVGGSEVGGGLVVRDSDVALVHATFTDSLALGRTTLHVGGTSTVDLGNSVIDGGCSIAGGTVTSEHFNVERPWGGPTSSTCNLGAGDRLVADLLVRPPAVYGGPHGVPTQPPMTGSEAAGLVSSGSCAAEDARTAPRIGLFCDAGAHETSGVAPGPWIFADGFESADTLAWSTSSP